MAAIDQLPGYGASVFAIGVLAGLCFGSFLNVVVHRLPIMINRGWRAEALETLAIQPPRRPRFDLALPRSRCTACGTTVAARDNVPVVSYMLLRGRCRACSAPIPLGYPLVELAGAGLAVAALAHWGVSWLALAHFGLLMALLALALIDFKTLLLPDQITVPLSWLGVLAAVALPTLRTPAEAVFGAAAGYLLLWAFYWGHKLLTGREGMGYGDFKLLAALGAWLGWQGILPVVLIASLAGLAFAAYGLVRGTATRATPIPFGTFLCIGGGATLFMKNSMLGV